MDIAKIIREFQAIFGITATERKWLTDQITAALPPAQEWQDISTAPTGDDDFYLVCCNDPADDRSPFVVRGSIFASARKHPPAHHLSMAYLTHWMPLPAKPVAIIADERGNDGA